MVRGRTDLHAEHNALRDVLRYPMRTPVYLDIKPGPLTAGEWRLFAERLAEITRQTTDSAAVS